MEVQYLREPTQPRYLYVDPETNTVHLLMPITSGTSISTDNTCRAGTVTQDFFGLKPRTSEFEPRPALEELLGYNEALMSDIDLLPEDSLIRQKKMQRRDQIVLYITALQKIQNRPEDYLRELQGSMPLYPHFMYPIFKEKANLFSIRLRPTYLDSTLRFIAPTFTLDRYSHGSWFWKALDTTYQIPLNIKNPHPKELLKEAVKRHLNSHGRPSFTQIQQELMTQTKLLLDKDVDYFKDPKLIPINPIEIELAMSLDSTSTSDEYLEGCMEGLFGKCTLDLWATIPISPFSVTRDNNGKNTLILLTQLFIAEINIHCYASKLSTADFGNLLDNNAFIRDSVPKVVTTSLQQGISVEKALFDFINNHYRLFGLNRTLDEDELDQLTQRFVEHFHTISDSPHFDEFLILLNKPGKFVTHQGTICIPYSEIIHSGLPADWDNELFVRARAEPLPYQVPSENKFVNNLSCDELRALLMKLAMQAQQDQSDAQLIQIALILLDKTESGRYLFQELDDETIQALTSLPWWETLKVIIGERISEPAVETLFYDCFPAYRTLTITHEQVARLYKGTLDSKIKPIIEADDLQQFLQEKVGLQDILYIDSAENNFSITIRVDSGNQLEELLCKLGDDDNLIYCSSHMIDAFYQEVVRLQGEDFPEVIAIRNQTNITDKIQALLNLLQISDCQDITPSPRNPQHAFFRVMSLASRGTIQSLLCYSSLPAAEKIQRFNQALQKLRNQAANLRQTAFAGAAADAADELVEELHDYANAYFFPDPSQEPVDYLTFKRNCVGAINSKKALLEKHHGWNTLLAQFVHVINTLISTLTFFTVNHFFKLSTPESVRGITEFKQELDTGFRQNYN